MVNTFVAAIVLMIGLGGYAVAQDTAPDSPAGTKPMTPAPIMHMHHQLHHHTHHRSMHPKHHDAAAPMAAPADAPKYGTSRAQRLARARQIQGEDLDLDAAFCSRVSDKPRRGRTTGAQASYLKIV